ncbi:MAG: SRPBCC family protein [Sphingomonadaceae bacterium]
MPAIERSILVEAPIDEVFAFVADYRNTTMYQRQFSHFAPIIDSPTHGLGMTLDVRGRFKGLPIRAKLRVTDFVPNELILSRSIEGLESTAEWRFAPEGGGTRVTFAARYAWPIPILGRTLRKMLEAELASMTTTSLRELKRLVEATQSVRRQPSAEGSLDSD